MTTTRFVSLTLLAGCLALAAGSAASWRLSRTASGAGTSDDGRGAELLPALVTVELEEPTAATPGGPRTIHVARYETAIRDWDRCVADGGCGYKPRKRRYHAADHPVTDVSWLDVQQYIRWLSDTTGRNFRLPKASEWDFMAKDVVEQETKKLWDDPRLAWAADYASYGLRKKKATHPVGHYGPNRQGIHDLDGNVWEWTDTCWRGSGSANEATENCGGARILAGAHKTYQSEFVREVPAGGCSIGFPPSNLGFRVVLDENPEVKPGSMLQALRKMFHLPSA